MPLTSGSSRSTAAARTAGTLLIILSLLLMGFVAHVSVISHLRHDRAQQTGYADFRYELANATAPIGQTDPETDRLHPMGTPVALLTIPALDVNEVVFEGTTSGVLIGGPGHQRSTRLPGQAGLSVIMGRQATYGGPFRDLADLRQGDTVETVTGQGEHTYQVRGVRRAGDPQPPPLDVDEGRLTLITAEGEPYLPNGVIYVDADLVSPPQPAPTRPLASRALDAGEDPMGQDAGARIPLLLWSQTLLLSIAAIAWARMRWGGWQAWVVGVPVLGAVGLTFFDQLARFLPNLI